MTERIQTPVVEPAPAAEVGYTPPEVALPPELAHRNPNQAPERSANVELEPGKDIFPQLQKDAAERGRPDMVGLEWKDAEGHRHVVSSYETIQRERSAPKHTRLPRVVKRPDAAGGGPIPVGRVWERVEYRDKYITTKQTIERRTVNVYDENDNLIDIQEYEGKERRPVDRGETWAGKHKKTKEYEEVDRFALSFRKKSKWERAAEGAYTTFIKPIEITDVKWGEKPAPSIHEQPIPKESIHVKLTDEGKVSFDQIITEQVEYGLENWKGLSWKDEKGKKKQVIGDSVVIRQDKMLGRDYPERLFEVRTSGENDSTIQREFFTMAELQKHFGSRDKLYPKAPELDLHWELPKLEPIKSSETPPEDPYLREQWEEQKAWSEWDETKKTPKPKPWYGREFSFDAEGNFVEPEAQTTDIDLKDAYELLAYPELDKKYITDAEGNVLSVAVDDEARAAIDEKVKQLKSDPQNEKIAEAVVTTMDEVGFDKFHAVVEKLQADYISDLHRLGIEVAPQEASLSWIIKDLMAQRVSGQGNAFEDTPDGHKLRRQAVNYRLGQRFYAAAIQPKEEVVSDDLATRVELQRKQVKGELTEQEVAEELAIRKPTERIRYAFKEAGEAGNPDHPPMVEKLRALLYRKEIESVLKKRKNSDEPELTDADYINIGNHIRLSFGQI